MIRVLLWRLWYFLIPEPAGLSPYDAARYAATKYRRTHMTTEELNAEIMARGAALLPKLQAKSDAGDAANAADIAVENAQATLDGAVAEQTIAVNAYNAADETFDEAVQEFADWLASLKIG